MTPIDVVHIVIKGLDFGAQYQTDHTPERLVLEWSGSSYTCVAILVFFVIYSNLARIFLPNLL